MLDVALSGFLGAVVGGVLSYFGAVRATKSAIESQETQYKLEKNDAKQVLEEKRRRHMFLIRQDMKVWIRFAIERMNRINRKLNKKPVNISYNDNFRDYLESFIEDLDYEELEFIIIFFGITKRINMELENIRFTTGNENEVLHNIEVLLIHIGLEDELDEIRNISLSSVEEDYFTKKTKELYMDIDLKLSNDIDI